MPDGLELRPVTRDQYRTIWDASAEAFRDHWGEQEWTHEDWVRFDADPHRADPRFWRIGWDGDEVAGAIVTTVPVEENERFGRPRVYVDMVSVRRPWRRRGLARALLASSLVGAARGRVHIGIARRRHRFADRRDRPVSVTRVRPGAHLHGLAQAAVTNGTAASGVSA